MSKVDKKTLIIEKAVECFTRFGYDKTTMADIGNAVGLNKGTLYYYFKNKESIFSAVYLYTREKNLREAETIIREAGSPVEKVLIYNKVRFFTMYDWAKTFPAPQGAQCIMPDFDKIYEKIKRLDSDYIKKVLDEGIKAGFFKECDTSAIADSMITTADALKELKKKQWGAALPDKEEVTLFIEEALFIIKLMLDGICR